MSWRKINFGLYIFAAIILFLSVSYVVSRVNLFRTNRHIERQNALVLEEYERFRAGLQWHQIYIVTSGINYIDTEFVGSIQVLDGSGQPVKAQVSVSFESNDSEDDAIVHYKQSFATDDMGRGEIRFILPQAGSLHIDIESEFGTENFIMSPHNMRIQQEQNLIINFDKGLYNPGDEVLFRILSLNSATAHPLSNYEYTISIFDGNDNRVFQTTATTSQFGIMSGSFRLADEVNSGMYRLTVEHSRRIQGEANFEVRPFVLPRFEISLETDKTEYNVGETVYLTGNVMYFFGEPVNQGTVSIYIDGSRELFADLDEYGNFSLEHITHTAGLVNFWVEVIDNSNFRVETSLSVRATDEPFEIELMPEHGYLVQGMSNTVYLFTNRADGTPTRAHIQVTGNGFSRQVATDENGVGMFILEDARIDNHITIRAVDMDGNVVEQSVHFPGVIRNITLSTNRPRFAMGENIELTLHQRDRLSRDGIFHIYAYRNNRLLQTITTEHDEAILNLGNTFGLIDIYAVWVSSDNTIPIQQLPFARRTIFVDPGYTMNFTIESNQDEYRPGAFASLNIGVHDNFGTPLDAALLVSIVDEAVLSVAANDLSIDNIRLALDDIHFSADLDAATLYASLIAGASEQSITRILLRQSSTPLLETIYLNNIHGRREYVLRETVIARNNTLWQRELNFLTLVGIIPAIAIFFALRSPKNAKKRIKDIDGKYFDYDSRYFDYNSNGPPPTEREIELEMDEVNEMEEKKINFEEKSKRAEKYTLWTVIIAIAVVLFALIFLSSCGSNDAASSTPRLEMVPYQSIREESLLDGGDSFWDFDGGMGTATPSWTPAPAAAAPPVMPDSVVSMPMLEAVESAPMPGAVTEDERLRQTNRADEPEQTLAVADAPAAPQEIETQTARVRRLFLETMLFVPELIARDGNATLDFMLADNITTWNIQVVGNTMDGIIGHSQSNLRVFQPFFVDFSLPMNSIRYDYISIPVTVFNYTEDTQTVILTIAEMDWFTLFVDPVQTLTIPANQSQMVYIPIRIEQFGNFVFRAYADTFNFADAAERPIRVNPEGFGIERVVSSGSIESSTWQHLLFMDEDIPDTRSAIVKFYPSAMSQLVEGMDNIFRMPHGCFEQTSSILYPNILALRYMQENNIINPALEARALGFISAGFQRILTFETGRNSGGFSLFGDNPAETILTAYGLMQLKALTTVYNIDERVLDRMADFLFDSQNSDGSFTITGRRARNIADRQRRVYNAYIIWALSETFPADRRLNISIDYLVDTLTAVDDNFTLALIANALINTGHPKANDVILMLQDNVIISGDLAHLTSNTRDFMGAYGGMQNLQTTALTSLAFTNSGLNLPVNNLLIDYVISRRDAWGTWHSTQATILSLKALIAFETQNELESGQIVVTIGNQQHIINVDGNNSLDFYQISFTGLERENIIDINFPDIGRMVYKIVINYFAPYDSVQLDRGFELTSQMRTELTIHERVEQEIRLINTSGMMVSNGLVAISIPQGFVVERDSLAYMRHQGIIERYETRHENINLYLRYIEPGQIIDFVIAYRPSFPVDVTGGHVRAFDYYNPTIEGFLMPVNITVVE